MVLGQSLKPGQFMRVEAARISSATKLQAEVNARLLHVGAQPPQWYAAKKKPPRAVVDGRVIEDGKAVGKMVAVAKGHAVGVPAKAMAADVSEKIDAMAPEDPMAMAVEHEAAPVEEPAEKPMKEEDNGGGFGGKRKKHR
jgi:hypothetical protein